VSESVRCYPYLSLGKVFRRWGSLSIRYPTDPNIRNTSRGWFSFSISNTGPQKQATSNLEKALQKQKEDLAEVHELLASLALTRYQSVFEDNGFDSKEVVVEMTEEHMQSLGMAMGHRIKLRKWIQSQSPATQQQALTVTHQQIASQAQQPPYACG